MAKILNKREKAILYFAVGIFAFSAAFNFILGPFFQENDKLNKDILLTKAKLKRYLQLIAQKDTIKTKYGGAFEELKGGSGQDSATVNALANLESLAKKSNIRIVEIRPQTTKSKTAYKEIFVDLRAEGSMENYLKFFYNIENTLSLMQIKKFLISSKVSAASLDGTLTISCILPE